MKYIVLTFDTEEFDIPLEYGQQIELSEQLDISREGFTRLIPILDEWEIQSTFFTTAIYAQSNQREILKLSINHEIASHGYAHTGFEAQDYSRSKTILEDIIQKPVYGFRMPRLAAVDIELIKKAGYHYDSSIQPTWIPGRYNSRHLPELLFQDHGLLRVPCSVSPSPIRFPLFWLSFKNFPLRFYRFWLNQTLTKHGMACLYFHPWEYADIGKYKLPRVVNTFYGQELLNKLVGFIDYYKHQGVQFISMKDYINREHPTKF